MSTDPTSLIRMCTQPVRQLSVRPLVWLAVLSTTASLACQDDLMRPNGTGQLVVRRGDQQDHNSVDGRRRHHVQFTSGDKLVTPLRDTAAGGRDRRD